MDSVTGLAIVKSYLISGSKDKNLRLWSLDHAINNAKHTFHAFNDYVTTIRSKYIINLGDPCLPILYSGSRDGQVKVCCVKNERV